MADIQAGDRVQARLRGESGGEEQWLVTEFTVSGIDLAGKVLGSFIYPTGLDPVQGWTFDLIRRPVILPDVAAEIVATTTAGEQVALVGKGDVWVRSDTGQRVGADDIREFTTDLTVIPVELPPVATGSPEGQ